MNPNNSGYIPLGRWTTGLYGCSEDPISCIKTCCCPCLTFAQNAEIIDRNGKSCWHWGMIFCLLGQFAFISSYPFRRKLRAQYSLPDFWVHCWCISCAICQECRELKNRGFDPSKGWEANAREINMYSMVPPVDARGMIG